MKSALRSTLFGAIALLIAGSLGAAGCARLGASAKDQPRLTDVKGYEEAYRAVQAERQLPPGFLWPDPPKQEEGTMFEEGVARSEVESYWVCAWETEWIEQHGKDAKREAAAMKVLKEDVPKCRMLTEYSDESVRAIYREGLEKAELGDPSGFQKDIELNGFVARRDK